MCTTLRLHSQRHEGTKGTKKRKTEDTKATTYVLERFMEAPLLKDFVAFVAIVAFVSDAFSLYTTFQE